MADCTRCNATIVTQPPGGEGWINKALMRRKTVHYFLRFSMWRFQWLPENPGNQVRSTYTELELCSGCAAAVFLFAQGKETGRG